MCVDPVCRYVNGEYGASTVTKKHTYEYDEEMTNLCQEIGADLILSACTCTCLRTVFDK